MTILASESFAGTDANPIGGNWTTEGGGSAIRRVSNAARGTINGDCAAYYNAVTPPADQYCKCVIGTSGGDQAAIVRAATNALTGYWAYWNAGGGNVILYTQVNNSTITSSSAAASLVTGDVLECRAVGTTISLMVNGIQKVSYVETSIASGLFGIYINDTSNVPSFTSFEGGDFNSDTALLGQVWS